MPYTPPSTSPSATPFATQIHLAENSVAKRNGKPLRPSQRPSAHRRPPVFRTISSSSRNAACVKPSPSPPERLDGVPNGAVVSPPDSIAGSDEDDSPQKMNLSRHVENLAELQAAIREISQTRTGSPPSSPLAAKMTTTITMSEHEMSSGGDATSAPRFRSALKLNFSPSGVGSKQANEAAVDMESDGETSPVDRIMMRAPPMIRKKSGELVKSSLKLPGLFRKRPSSMPSTPTYPKNVHFDAKLEHVRHFLQAERPTAVSVDSSPVESFADEKEYPFALKDNDSRGWEIQTPNFPFSKRYAVEQAVWVDRIYLSKDSRSLIGQVLVRNLAFQKWVAVRFTVDHWQTVSEVSAEYDSMGSRQRTDGLDNFTFAIKLHDLANLENKTLFFCVRYRVGTSEYWDNNDNANYQVIFKKKRSGPLPRVGSLPDMKNTFADAFESADQGALNSTVSYIGSVVLESPRYSLQRSPKPENVFAGRYDFGVSLNAAIAAAKSGVGQHRRESMEMADLPWRRADLSKDIKQSTSPPDSPPVDDRPRLIMNRNHVRSNSDPLNTVHGAQNYTSAVGNEAYNEKIKEPTGVLPKEEEIERAKPSLNSTSYLEFLKNYCFVSNNCHSFLTASIKMRALTRLARNQPVYLRSMEGPRRTILRRLAEWAILFNSLSINRILSLILNNDHLFLQNLLGNRHHVQMSVRMIFSP